MALQTPYSWLLQIAGKDPNRPCLVERSGIYTYQEILAQVNDRAEALTDNVRIDSIVPIEVDLTVASVVELLAIRQAGGVPMPWVGREPALELSQAPGAAICVATSGSGGDPRIIPLTDGNIAASVSASRALLGNTASDRWLLSLPLNHVGGLSVIWRSLEAGGSCAIAPLQDPDLDMASLQPTVASLVPTMLYRLVETSPGVVADLRWVLIGGASLSQELHDRVAPIVEVLRTYGMTEACSQIATRSPVDFDAPSGSVGRPLGGFTIEIVDDHLQPLPPGEVGRVTVDGPAVFAGYLGEPGRSGPYLTNDLGWIGEHGYLTIDGRIDDVIVSGGENTSIRRIGDAIRRFKGVADVCVVSVHHDEWGTVACAMIQAVGDPTDFDRDSFDTMMRQEALPHERPKRWMVERSIPLLANGKHDGAAVRRHFEEEPWT